MSDLTITDGGNYVTFSSTTGRNDTFQKGKLLMRRDGDDFIVTAADDRRNVLVQFQYADVVTPATASADALETFLQTALFA